MLWKLVVCSLFLLLDLVLAKDFCSIYGVPGYCPYGYKCCDRGDGTCCANGFFCSGAICIAYWVVIGPVIGGVVVIVACVACVLCRRNRAAATQGTTIATVASPQPVGYGQPVTTGYPGQYPGQYPLQQQQTIG